MGVKIYIASQITLKDAVYVPVVLQEEGEVLVVVICVVAVGVVADEELAAPPTTRHAPSTFDELDIFHRKMRQLCILPHSLIAVTAKSAIRADVHIHNNASCGRE